MYHRHVPLSCIISLLYYNAPSSRSITMERYPLSWKCTIIVCPYLVSFPSIITMGRYGESVSWIDIKIYYNVPLSYVFIIYCYPVSWSFNVTSYDCRVWMWCITIMYYDTPLFCSMIIYHYRLSSSYIISCIIILHHHHPSGFYISIMYHYIAPWSCITSTYHSDIQLLCNIVLYLSTVLLSCTIILYIHRVLLSCIIIVNHIMHHFRVSLSRNIMIYY